MYKLFFATLAATTLVGCASHPPTHTPHPEERQPSSNISEQPQYFGKVKFSEGKHTSGSADDITGEVDAFYTLQVDCNKDFQLSREEQGRIVRISADSVLKAQKTAYATFKKRAETKEKKASATPYLSVSLESISGNPCSTKASPIGRVLVGTNPTFFSPRR